MRVVLKHSETREAARERERYALYLDKVSSYDDPLTKANLTTLHLGRLKMLATEVYKSVLEWLNPGFAERDQLKLL